MIIPPNEAVNVLEAYSANISIECPVPHCRAARGEPCRDTPPATVHESRKRLRLKREGEKSP
jgi:hypothetical protein